MTTMNALRYAFETSAEDETRRWVLLQAAAFMPMFRGEIASRKEAARGHQTRFPRADRAQGLWRAGRGGDFRRPVEGQDNGRSQGARLSEGRPRSAAD